MAATVAPPAPALPSMEPLRKAVPESPYAASSESDSERLEPAGKHRRNGSNALQTSHLSRRWTNRPDEQLNSRKSLVTDDLTTAVRKLLTAVENAEVDNVMLNQFLRATKHDTGKAARRLKDTVAWRLAEQPHLKMCQKCMTRPRAHFMHVVGFSKKDEPIIYSCLAMAKDHDVLANREHMLVTFEQAIRAMPPHVERWIWLSDFHGFGLRDCDPRLAKMFLDISEKHYPERLSEFMNISVPSVFNVLWKAIEPWVDPVTRQKVKFVGFDAKLSSSKNAQIKQELSRLVEPDVQEWLLEEMAQNRRKLAIKKKVYPYGKVHSPDGGSQAVILEGHDSRGSAEWIKAVEQNPHILVPGTGVR